MIQQQNNFIGIIDENLLHSIDSFEKQQTLVEVKEELKEAKEELKQQQTENDKEM